MSWRICRRRPRGPGLFSRGSRSRSRPGSWERWVRNDPARPCPGSTLPWGSPSRRASTSPASWIRSTLSWPFLDVFPQRMNLLLWTGSTAGGDRATGKNSRAMPPRHHAHGSKSSHGQPFIGRPADSVDSGARSALLLDPASNGNSGRSFDNLSPYGAHFFRVVASAASPEAL